MSTALELIIDTFSGPYPPHQSTILHNTHILHLPSSIESTYMPFEEWSHLKKNNVNQDEPDLNSTSVAPLPISAPPLTTIRFSSTLGDMSSNLLATTPALDENNIESTAESFIITPPTNLYSYSHSTHQSLSHETAAAAAAATTTRKWNSASYNSTNSRYNNGTTLRTQYSNPTSQNTNTNTRTMSNTVHTAVDTISSSNTQGTATAEPESSNNANNKANKILWLTIINLLL